MALDRNKTWNAELYFDLEIPPGAFIRMATPGDPGFYMAEVIPGVVVKALNFYHADYMTVKEVAKRAGHDHYKCGHCGANLRHTVVIVAEDGAMDVVGTDCAEKLCGGFSDERWAERKMLADIKKVATARGERHVLNFQVPDWFWDLRRAGKCPASVSVRKVQAPAGGWGRGYGRRRGPVDISPRWYAAIWGETPAEVVDGWVALMTARREAMAAV